MKIGILSVQGAFAEHEAMLASLGAVSVRVRLPEHLEGISFAYESITCVVPDRSP